MNNTFLTRVAAERQVLKVVNEELSQSNQLTGLSKAAIRLWCEKMGYVKHSPLISHLFTIGKHCQRLSDRSHETFSPLDASTAEQIQIGIIRLRESLRVSK